MASRVDWLTANRIHNMRQRLRRVHSPLYQLLKSGISPRHFLTAIRLIRWIMPTAWSEEVARFAFRLTSPFWIRPAIA